MDKLLLTPREAADVLGIGRSKLYELLRAGTVPSVRIGACRRIAALDLENLVDKLRTADDVFL
ncbi:MAG: helix-turn-helix domain-containing protein [Acidothermaceae bacterium]